MEHQSKQLDMKQNDEIVSKNKQRTIKIKKYAKTKTPVV